MAIKDYTLAELKIMILNQANNIKGLYAAFVTTDADEAYDEAVRETGFELPVTTDTDKCYKYQWLINRMRRWYMFQLFQQYVLRFKGGDMEAQQIFRNLQIIIDKMDLEFKTAKEGDLSYLFTNADIVFGSDLVIGTGFIEDRLNESTQDELDARTS